MKKLLRYTLLSVVVAGSAAMAASSPSTPPLQVTVSGPSGKVAFKGKTKADGTFSTASLSPGTYVVQIRSDDPAVKKDKYAMVVSAAKKKVSAADVAGEKLASGVAMKVEVASGANITGQVSVAGGAVKPGMVWIPPMLGSNMPGHWAEEGSPEAVESKTRGVIRKDSIQNLQEKARGAPNGG